MSIVSREMGMRHRWQFHIDCTCSLPSLCSHYYPSFHPSCIKKWKQILWILYIVYQGECYSFLQLTSSTQWTLYILTTYIPYYNSHYLRLYIIIISILQFPSLQQVFNHIINGGFMCQILLYSLYCTLAKSSIVKKPLFNQITKVLPNLFLTRQQSFPLLVPQPVTSIA